MTCTWNPDPACLSADWAALTDEQRERSLMLATSSLQMLTYYRVGTCPVTIRPCPRPPRCGHAWNPWILSEGTGASDVGVALGGWDVGRWDLDPWDVGSADPRLYNNCSCHSWCSPLSEVDIPGPVGYIETLMIDGQPVDLWNGDWRLDNGHLLVWQGAGVSPIPETQDINKPDTELGTWSITYSRSYPVLPDARLAVAYLAMEFAKACKPTGKCSLPRGVTNVVRNGVSFTIQAGLFPNGLTGIEIVDAFILKWAPAGSPTRSAAVFDPRNRGPRRTNSVPLRGPVGSV